LAEHNCASRNEFFEREKDAAKIIDERGSRLRLAQEWVTLGMFEIPDNETFYACFLIHRDSLANRDFDDVMFFIEH
jgi:muconolactone delta-isomerase